MTRLSITLVLIATLTPGRSALAQTPAPAGNAPSPGQTAMPMPTPPGPRGGDLVSLDVQVTITRVEEGKVTSTRPYTLAVTTNAGEAQLNMGAEVPLSNNVLTTPSAQGATATPPSRLAQVTYRTLGTVITCRAMKADDGRYQLVLQVDDSAYASEGQATASETPPTFRAFRSRNTIMMSDGQSRQFTAASDRATGEVVRVEVAMRVVK